MAYATVEDIQARLMRTMSETEMAFCSTKLDDVAIEIDRFNVNASDDIKKVVSCRVVIRLLDTDNSFGVPIGATQGSMAGLGYSQSYTISGGSTGETYLSSYEKKLLGIGNKIGSYSPVEELATVVSI